jgi:hypothetical protein
MKISNFALSLSIVSAVVLLVALLYTGSSNVGSMRTQIGTDISAVSIPGTVNSIAVNRVQPTVNSIAVNRIQPTVNSIAVNRIQPINSPQNFLTLAY